MLRRVLVGLVFITTMVLISSTRSDALAVSIHPVVGWVPTELLARHDGLPKGIENWGLETAGFDMSITLEKETFVLGETLKLWLVTRNVSDQTQATVHFYASGLRMDIELTVIDANGEPVLVSPVAEAERVSGRSGGKTEWCRVGMAVVESINIANVLQFKPGHSYYVNATKRVASLKTGERSQVTSGNAMFRITTADGTGGVQTPENTVAIAAAIPANPKRMGITLPLPTPWKTNPHPVRPSAAFAGGPSTSKRTAAQVPNLSDAVSGGLTTQSKLITPAPSETSPRFWTGVFAFALTGLIVAIFVNAVRRKRLTGNGP